MKRGMSMTLAKFGKELRLVKMFKEPNLEEICFAKSRDYQISRFCENVQVFLFVFNYFSLLVMLNQWNQLAATS